MQGWLSSPGHCRNVLSPAWVDIGIGISAESPPLWTQNFGRQESAPQPSAEEGPMDSCPQPLLRSYGVDPAICERATEKLRRAQKRLKKLRRCDAGTAAIARARNRVKEARETLREVCN